MAQYYITMLEEYAWLFLCLSVCLSGNIMNSQFQVSFSFYDHFSYSGQRHPRKVFIKPESGDTNTTKVTAVKQRKKLHFGSRKRKGMTAAYDTAYQKRGFDSLTGKGYSIKK